MTEPYMGVLIQQEAGGPVTVKFSDPNYHHPEITQDSIWKAIAGMLEHYFTVHSEVYVMAQGETDNVHYLPKQIEESKVEADA